MYPIIYTCNGRWDICGRTFADRYLRTGYLRTDTCGRTFADETFEKFNFFKKFEFCKRFVRKCPVRKSPSENVRPQMSRPQVSHKQDINHVTAIIRHVATILVKDGINNYICARIMLVNCKFYTRFV